MKLRLFILLSVLFLFVALLMPVGVYASEPTPVTVTGTATGTEDVQATICSHGEVFIGATVVVEDGTASPTDAPALDSPCDGDDDGFARVSWNS